MKIKRWGQHFPQKHLITKIIERFWVCLASLVWGEGRKLDEILMLRLKLSVLDVRRSCPLCISGNITRRFAVPNRGDNTSVRSVARLALWTPSPWETTWGPGIPQGNHSNVNTAVWSLPDPRVSLNTGQPGTVSTKKAPGWKRNSSSVRPAGKYWRPSPNWRVMFLWFTLISGASTAPSVIEHLVQNII